MASRLKYWGALVLGCVAVMLWIRLWNPDRSLPPYYRERLARIPQQMKIANALTDAHRMHAQLTIGDTTATLMAAARDSIVIVQSPRMSQAPDVLQSIVSNELSTRRPLRARVGVFVFNSDLGSYQSALGANNAQTMYFTGSDRMGPYCIAAMPLSAASAAGQGVTMKLDRVRPDTSVTESKQRRSLLGPCVFWAQYGTPGAGVEKWLRQGGYHFALAPAALLSKPAFREKRLFGHRGWSPPDLAAYACQAGDSAACANAIGLNGPRDTAPQFAAHELSAFDDYPQIFSYRDGTMLAEIEREFGPEKFGAFWHSTLAPEAAFSASFGTPFGEWTRAWAQKWFGAESRGPSIDVVSWAMCALLLAALTMVSCLIARNRQVL